MTFSNHLNPFSNPFSSSHQRPFYQPLLAKKIAHPVWMTLQGLWLGLFLLALVATSIGVGQAIATVSPASVPNVMESLAEVTATVANPFNDPLAVANVSPSFNATPADILDNPTLLEPFADPAEVPTEVLNHTPTLQSKAVVTKPKWAFWHRPPRAERAALTWPLLHVTISSGFGRRFGTRHEGMDLTAPVGTDVLTAAPGRVTFAGTERGYGNMITIDHGYGVSTRYAHLSRISVSVGDRVLPRQVIGAVGMTGHTSGPHLHFEVRKDSLAKDPENYLADVT